LKFQTAAPVESVVALFVTLPVGVTIVNVTVAPATPAVPCATNAEIGTVFRTAAGGAFSVIDSGVAGGGGGGGGGAGITVRFATPSKEWLHMTAITASAKVGLA